MACCDGAAGGCVVCVVVVGAAGAGVAGAGAAGVAGAGAAGVACSPKNSLAIALLCIPSILDFSSSVIKNFFIIYKFTYKY
jgi:hypothetical protein